MLAGFSGIAGTSFAKVNASRSGVTIPKEEMYSNPSKMAQTSFQLNEISCHQQEWFLFLLSTPSKSIHNLPPSIYQIESKFLSLMLYKYFHL